jgi:hypothetical protein
MLFDDNNGDDEHLDPMAEAERLAAEALGAREAAEELKEDEDTEIALSAGAGGAKAALRPFTVKTKKSKVPYTFKRFRRAHFKRTERRDTIIFLLPDDDRGTLEERSRLYDETAYRLEEMREKIAECATRGVRLTADTVEVIVPISWLTIDQAWCRGKPIDSNHVAEIVTNFSSKSLDPPKVTMRKVFDSTGRLIGVVISLTDGVHRTVGLYEIGDTHVRAMVTTVDDVADEAQIYSDGNYGRRGHARQDIMRALITSEDPKIEQIRALIGDYGFKIQDPSDIGKCVPPVINGVKTLISCFDRFGEVVLRRVMHLLGDPRFPYWQFNQTAMSSDFMTALCRYVAEFEQPGYVHTDMTTHLFETMTPETIRGFGLTMTTAAQIADVLGYQPCRSNVISNSENSRIIQILTGMVAMVRNFYKPKMRPENFHPKFKSALDVHYDKNMSAAEKADAISAIRRNLAKIKRHDGWYDADSSLVR